MIQDKSGQKLRELRQQADKLVSQPLEDFQRLPAEEVQNIIHDLVISFEELVTQNNELRAAQTRLEQSQKWFLDLFDFAPVGYFSLDRNGTIVDVNFTGSHILGTAKNNLIKKPFNQFVEKNSWGIFAEHLIQGTQSGSIQSFDIEMCRENGTTLYAQLQIVPLPDQISGRYRVALTDITQSKTIEQALKESEERFRNLFESMEEGFALCEMIYDKDCRPVDFRFLEVNPAFAMLTGLPLERVIGRTVKELIPNIEPFWIETYAKIVESGVSQRIDNPVSELKKYYEAHAWRSGVGRFAVVFHDITDLKRCNTQPI